MTAAVLLQDCLKFAAAAGALTAWCLKVLQPGFLKKFYRISPELRHISSYFIEIDGFLALSGL